MQEHFSTPPYVLKSVDQKPVAVTLQVNSKLKLPMAGSVARVKPPPVNRFGHWPAAGHTALPPGVQLVTEQLKPALGTSRTIAPSAAAGPVLVKVSV